MEKITFNWNRNIGAETQKISKVEIDLDLTLPNDYKTFLNWSNGGEGDIGENYISLWKIEDLITLNEDYQIQKYLTKDYLAIGTDGGGICYGFKTQDGFSIFKCPLGDLHINEVTILAKSFEQFIKKADTEEL